MLVSLFASAVRPQFFKTFLDSLKSTSVDFEVIFAGNLSPTQVVLFMTEYPFFRYTHTENIKPCQDYEIARRACTGELVHWTADDCEYSEDCIGKAYRHWKSLNEEKTILSIQTKENGMFCDMTKHDFFGWRTTGHTMAPLGLMSRKLLDDMGGYDRRYICGQGENDFVMRTFALGGRVEIWGDKDNLITIDHYRRHGIYRPFAKGYEHDRSILEGTWIKDGKITLERQDTFEPFEETDILTKSQSFNLPLWI